MARRSQWETRPLDEGARAQAEEHFHLVGMLAREQFHRCGRTVPLEELVGEAQLALAYAASLYEVGRGVPFGAYVTRVIRHRLIQAVTQWRRGGRLDHAHFSDLAGGEAGGPAWPFDPPCPRTREPGQAAADRELLECVRRGLPPRWFLLLELYYAQEHTLEEIGRQIGVSRERVRQLLTKAVTRAREHCRAEGAHGA